MYTKDLQEYIQSLSQYTDVNQESTITADEDIADLKIEKIIEGTGQEAQNGDLLSVNYAGILTDGTEFDSSYSRGVPFQFVLGSGQVIRGWDLGVLGMKVGGKRKLTIPSELAYGDRGVGSIPPGATLVFEVELLEILNQ